MPQNGARPIDYPYRFVAPSNTGIPSGFDLDNNGRSDHAGTGGGNDAFGFGLFPGQFGMAVYSMHSDRLPQASRTFQIFLWKDMPGALLPDDPATAAPHDWYSPAELAIFRLSSKSHWDVPIEIGHGKDVHFLVSHPTPPVFDGPEDRNGTRNHDEIRFWADYITPRPSGYIYDDAGRRGGLQPGAALRDRRRPELRPARRRQHPGLDPAADRAPARQRDARRRRARARPEQAALQGGANLTHQGDPALRHGRLRRRAAPRATCAPTTCCRAASRSSSSARVLAAFDRPALPAGRDVRPGVLPNGNGFPSSDHRLVAVDVEVRRHDR